MVEFPLYGAQRPRRVWEAAPRGQTQYKARREADFERGTRRRRVVRANGLSLFPNGRP